MLTQNYPPCEGGIAIFDQHICRELQRNGVLVEVVAQDVKGASTADGGYSYPIHRFPVLPALSALAPIMSTLVNGLKSRTDVVFLGHMQSTYALGAWLLWWTLKVPYVVLIHGFDLVEYWRQSRVDNAVSRLILRDAALVFANSQYTRAVVLERLGTAEHKVQVLNPGVNPDVFRPGLEISAVKQRYGIAGERVILTVSRLVPKKNHETVLLALPEVLKRVPNLKYLIVGDGPERAKLERLVQELALQEHVVFTGAIKHHDLPSYYCSCDVFVMPSRIAEGNFESFGIAFAEAAACGKPVIGSKTGGIADAVIHGTTGLLVDPNDVGELAQALIHLLTDGQVAVAFGHKGRARVAKELTWQAVGAEVFSSLRRLRPVTEDAGDA